MVGKEINLNFFEFKNGKKVLYNVFKIFPEAFWVNRRFRTTSSARVRHVAPTDLLNSSMQKVSVMINAAFAVMIL